MSIHPRFPKERPDQSPWVMLTAYDALMAQEAECGGADILLVGDSLGKAVLGYEDETEVSLSDIQHHCKAVVRGTREIPIIADLPFETYEDPELALNSSHTLMETGVDMVKLEGFKPEIFAHLLKHEIHAVAHLGYTPQTASKEGSKVVGKTISTAETLLEESKKLEEAGACALVLEMVPREVAYAIQLSLKIPVIGIGSGPDVDGQVLVITDMWGESDVEFKFLKKFSDLKQAKIDAVNRYVTEVKAKTYPSDSHSFHILKKEKDIWLKQYS